MCMIACPSPLYIAAPTTGPPSPTPYSLVIIYAYPQSRAVVLKSKYKSRRSERIQFESNFPQHQPSGQKGKWLIPSHTLPCMHKIFILGSGLKMTYAPISYIHVYICMYILHIYICIYLYTHKVWL